MGTEIKPLREVIIYTDGACEPNPGPGGYGIVLIYGGARKEIAKGFRRTTNNRMELMAVVEGLKALKEKCKVTIYSDSKYVVNALSLGWAKKWKANGWWRNNKGKAKNPDLLDEALKLYERNKSEIKWVRGHTGIPENEQCDWLAMNALNGDDLKIDEGYENPKEDYYSDKVNIVTEAKKSGKIRMTEEGQACRVCSTPVVKKTPKLHLKPGQTYYYLYYLYCPKCTRMYMVEEAKRMIDKPYLIEK